MNQNNKYFLYVRKSSEGEDRQVQSLWDQIDVMTKKAQQLGINIIGIFSESQSAKAPWRKEFNKMIALLYEWKADGIIAWKLDRLSRNPIDTGTVQYMLQNGTLQKIITSDREYHPVDAGLLMSVETGMANQYIIDLRKNVLRGMNSKTEKGIFCGQAPEWYRNNKEEKTIEIDALNFRLVRKAWDFLLSWIYTVPQIVEMINTDYAYKSNKKWWKEMTIWWLYGIFKNVFYTGNFMWKWEIKTGTHAPMISMQEFEKAQDILGRKWTKIRPKTLEFAYSGIIRCGECWSSIVATQKTKLIKTSWETKDYIYYHCSKRKKWCSCSQKRITLETLESQIESYLEKIEIIPEFRDFALKILKNSYKDEIQNQEFLKKNIKQNITDIEKKIERLLDLLIDRSVSNDIYQKKKELLQKELCIYRENSLSLKLIMMEWLKK